MHDVFARGTTSSARPLVAQKLVANQFQQEDPTHRVMKKNNVQLLKRRNMVVDETDIVLA